MLESILSFILCSFVYLIFMSFPFTLAMELENAYDDKPLSTWGKIWSSLGCALNLWLLIATVDWPIFEVFWTIATLFIIFLFCANTEKSRP